MLIFNKTFNQQNGLDLIQAVLISARRLRVPANIGQRQRNMSLTNALAYYSTVQQLYIISLRRGSEREITILIKLVTAKKS